ncbi:MAG: glycosyltransferase [Burkholderiales bacterium]
MHKTCFFTIVSNNYRHFARTLIASVRRNDPGIDAFVAICDGPSPALDPRDTYTEIRIHELGLPKFDRFTFQYTILELNTAIKPSVIAALFERGYERVIYFDPDIKVYGSVAPILERLDEAQIVLTPHLTGPLDDDKRPSELEILQSGSYNLGFIALRQTPETRKFVRWWQRKLERDCVVDIPRGLFTDQKWMDLVPGMFAHVHVERDAGWNVAYWNLKHRVVTREDDRLLVNGRPLLFFHFSGFEPGAHLLSKHQNRYTMDDVTSAVRGLADAYATDLVLAGYEECRRVPYAFGRFLDGAPIPDQVRRCYRENFPPDEAHPDLWSESGQRFLLDWLNGPAPGHRQTPWLSRLAVALHRRREDLQRAFPDLSGGDGRRYAHWYVEHAAQQERIPEAMIAPVRTALAAKPAVAPGTAGPMATAQDTADGGLLRVAYRMAYRAAWRARWMVKPLTSQAFRHSVRHALLRKAYYDDQYTTPPLSLGNADLASAADPASGPAIVFPAHTARHAQVRSSDVPGVNVIGYLTAESGVGESARSMLRILKAAGIPVNAIDFRIGNVSRKGETIPGVAKADELYGINLFHINADQMFVARDGLGPSLFAGRYNVGCWAWELSAFPDVFVPALALVDEVWTLSSFAQQAIALKSAVPVLRVPCSIEAPAVAPDRTKFGLEPDTVVFFAMCDVLSVPERKNPLGVVEAFARAFPGRERVRLVLKVGNIEAQPDLYSRLRSAADADPRIMLIIGYLTRPELWSLMVTIDCFVSLHRAEGFGLGMAEAMACGKAVIATGYSGNTDFTRPGNSLVVDYALATLKRDLGPYRRGEHWAEPNLDSAAAAMREVAESADLRHRLGERGLDTVASELSPPALASPVRERLAVIDSILAKRHASHPVAS